MELTVQNFRSIVNKKYNFPKGNTLISGESGSGKSTILESIIWCFYGGPSVSPFGSGNSKKVVTKVEIKIENMIITRTKPPDKCHLVLEDGRKLEHDEAQTYLINMFGTKSLWETSSYLKQDTRSNLLFSSSQDKYSIVKEIIFGNDDNKNSPEIYLGKLSSFSKNLDFKLNNYEGKIELLKDNIEEMIQNLASYNELERDKKKLIKLIKKYDSVREGIEKLKTQITTLKTMEENKNKLVEVERNLESFPILTMELVERWKVWDKSAKELKTYDLNFERIETNENIEDLEMGIKFTERDYKQFRKNTDKCKELNVPYDEDSILKEINKTETSIRMIEEYSNYINIMKNVKKIDDTIKKYEEHLIKLQEKEGPYSKGFGIILEKLNCDKGEFNLEKVSQIKEKISNIMTDYLKCPHCNKNTVFENGELVIKECRFMTKTELEKIKKNLKNIIIFYEKKEKLTSELNNYKTMRKEMEIPDKALEEKGDIGILKKYIINLNSIIFIDYNNEEFEERKTLLEKLKRQEKIEILENKIEDSWDPIFDDYDTPKNFSSYFERYRKLISEKEIITNHLNKNDTGDIGEIKAKLDKLVDTLVILDNFKLYQGIEDKKLKLSNLNEEYKQLVKKREKCHELKKIIEEESALTFENMILTFNDILNEIVGEIFEDISIHLGMFKKLKGKGDLKPQFNMKVLLKDNEYDNLNFLSGGEKDRISIALTLTLSTLLNKPIIMFDESMSSLDEEMRERCLELIKKYAGDKILINICHSTIEGYYDNIIRK